MTINNIKPTLKHNPDSYSYRDLLVKFSDGIPLSCDQFNFLVWHEKTLSNQLTDPMLKYYLKHYHQKRSNPHSFLLPGEVLNEAAIVQFKKRLGILLQTKGTHVELSMTPKEFSEFKGLAYKELIFYHGNQLLTGAPFYPGGLPHIIYFQWGNSFGIAKYVVLAGEKALKSNVLIYFEDMLERDLDQCVEDYSLQLRNQMHPQQQLSHTPHIYAEPAAQSMFHIPTLTLGNPQSNDEREQS